MELRYDCQIFLKNSTNSPISITWKWNRVLCCNCVLQNAKYKLSGKKSIEFE